MQNISISDIYSKLKSKEDIINYFRELGKFLNNNKSIGLYYPKLSCYDNKFFLQVLANKKKVSK